MAMQPMPPKYYRRLQDAHGFVESVQKYLSRARKRPLQASLEAFEDDPFLLYTCLWYAWSQGVSVTFRAGESSPPAAETGAAGLRPDNGSRR